jgi:hypothetical protein
MPCRYGPRRRDSVFRGNEVCLFSFINSLSAVHLLSRGRFPGCDQWGPAGPHYNHEGLRPFQEVCGMEIQEKIDTLLKYREALDDSEKEVFDVLMSYANEVAISIDGDAARALGQGY